MTNKKRKTILYILRIILIIVSVFLLLRLSSYCVPFIIAFILSSLIEPLVRFLEKKVKIPRKLGSVVSLLFVLATLGTILTLIISRLVKEIINVYNHINEIFGGVQQFIGDIVQKASSFYISLPKTITDTLDGYFAQEAKNIQGKLEPIITKITSFTMSLPQVVIFIVVTILATYFMSSDRKNISAALDKEFSKESMSKTRNIVNKMFTGLFGWLKAQLILMTITFTELLIAFMVMRIENGLLLAVIIAVIDAIPVLGVGTVLIPWGIIQLIAGDTRLGIFILLVYVVVLLIRQFIEPKIVGREIGVHPLLTLMAMYLGLQFFGVLGMIAGPIMMVVIKTLWDAIFETETFGERVKRIFDHSVKTDSEVKEKITVQKT